MSSVAGPPHLPEPGADRAARSLRVLLGFLAASVLVLMVVSRVVGPVSMEGWHLSSVRPAWELPMPVRSTVWYIELVLVSAAAWLVWAYPQPGLRRRAVALLAANLFLAGVARPILLALAPGQGAPALWALIGAMAVLAGILAVAAVGLWKTHRVSSLLMIPCISWAGYVAAVNLARIVAV